MWRQDGLPITQHGDMRLPAHRRLIEALEHYGPMPAWLAWTMAKVAPDRRESALLRASADVRLWEDRLTPDGTPTDTPWLGLRER